MCTPGPVKGAVIPGQRGGVKAGQLCGVDRHGKRPNWASFHVGGGKFIETIGG
jgi:hypothetical protein